MRSFASIISRKVALVAAISFAATASAYIPPSWFIVEKIARKHQNAKTVRVKSRVTAFADGRPSDTQFVAVTTFDAATGALESFATDDSGQRLYSIERKTPSLPAAMTLDSSERRLTSRLREAGIEVKEKTPGFQKAATEAAGAGEPSVELEPMTLARWKTAVAWVLGERKGDESQLWVEKDAFLPVRLMTTGEGGFQDVQFEGYRFHREFPYPQAISLARRDGAVTLRAETLEVAVNPGASRSGGKSGWTDAGSSAPASVRELISSYYAALQ